MPKGCSTVSLRICIRSGSGSSRCCTRSSTSSCSQRDTRRYGLVVHCLFYRAPWTVRTPVLADRFIVLLGSKTPYQTLASRTFIFVGLCNPLKVTPAKQICFDTRRGLCFGDIGCDIRALTVDNFITTALTPVGYHL